MKPDIGISVNHTFSFKVSYAYSRIFGICLSGDCEDSYTVELSFGKSDKINGVGFSIIIWPLRIKCVGTGAIIHLNFSIFA